ncbi:MAG: SDR family oxidoreductase [Dehalococcoidales bacterium]|nr:SDR family oxidoreductase [Dehalococcoidales bacterium]
MLLPGKVAIITGSTSGIGRAGAIAFAQEGASVVISGRNKERGGEVVETIKQQGGRAHFVAADMLAAGDIEQLVKAAVDIYGRLDIFWHNAGIVGPDDIQNISPESYEKVMAVHLKAAVFGVKFALPRIRKAGGGAILFTSSVAGLKQSGYSLSYSLAKSGLVMLTRKLAVDLAKDNIRVNCLCPGRVQTGMRPDISQERARALGITPEEWEKRDKKRIPLGRFITEQEVADAALFLVSDKASGITGVALPVDGGFLAV